MVRHSKDVEIGKSVSTVCNNYFNVPTRFLGYIEYENMVWQSVRSKIPLLVNSPNTRLLSNFSKLYRALMGKIDEKLL